MPNTSKNGPPVVCIRLKQLREGLGLKQREMAKILGDIPQDHYKHFEGRTRPTRELVTEIERHFGLSPSIFLSDETIPESDFNQIVGKLRDGLAHSGAKFISYSQTLSNTDGGREQKPYRVEGQLGQGSIDFILGALAEIKADIAKNRQAIADLQEEQKSRQNFKKGRR